MNRPDRPAILTGLAVVLLILVAAVYGFGLFGGDHQVGDPLSDQTRILCKACDTTFTLTAEKVRQANAKIRFGDQVAGDPPVCPECGEQHRSYLAMKCPTCKRHFIVASTKPHRSRTSGTQTGDAETRRQLCPYPHEGD